MPSSKSLAMQELGVVCPQFQAPNFVKSILEEVHMEMQMIEMEEKLVFNIVSVCSYCICREVPSICGAMSRYAGATTKEISQI